MIYNTKVIFYNNEIQISKYDYAIGKAGTEEEIKIREKEKEKRDKANSNNNKQLSKCTQIDVADMSKNNQARSVRRTIQSIYQIARANNFDYFATFTFSDSSYRYNYDECKSKMRKWFNNFKNRYSDIEYLAVPEMHKDCAWHFHALIKGNLQPFLVQGVHTDRYILPCFTYGINEVEPIKDSNRCSSYITKYITKELAVNTNHKRRYIYSKGLNKPDVRELYVDDERMSLYEFIANHFPEYTMTYQKNVETAGYKVNYIQLAKKE